MSVSGFSDRPWEYSSCLAYCGMLMGKEGHFAPSSDKPELNWAKVALINYYLDYPAGQQATHTGNELTNKDLKEVRNLVSEAKIIRTEANKP